MLNVTATELARFVPCNGSVSMVAESTVDVENPVREEGNAAHWLCEQVFNGKFKIEELLNKKAPNGVFITQEMIDNCSQYLDDIIGWGAVEYDNSYSGVTWRVTGRADHAGIIGDALWINDFKYGWGIVEPEENWTLISHAVGFLTQSVDANLQKIIFKIYQPRPYHSKGQVRKWEITAHELWNIYFARMRAALDNPQNTLNTGKHCYKCPVMASCPAAQKAGMNAIEISEDVYQSEVSNKDLSFLLDQTKRALDVLTQNHKAYSEMALHRIKKGGVVQNYSVVKELTNLQWKGYVNAEVVKCLTGVDVTRKELVTPTQAKKLICNTALDNLSTRHEKGAKLVRADANAQVDKFFNKVKGK